MLKDIVTVQPREGYQLHLQFEDGIEGVVDLSQLIKFSGIFAPLKEFSYFTRVQVHPELGTIFWENGADLEPDILYAMIAGEPITNYEQSRISVN